MGLSNAVLLTQHNKVIALDIVQAKVDLINARRSPIEDTEIEHYLADKPFGLRKINGVINPAAIFIGTGPAITVSTAKIARPKLPPG